MLTNHKVCCLANDQDLPGVMETCNICSGTGCSTQKKTMSLKAFLSVYQFQVISRMKTIHCMTNQCQTTLHYRPRKWITYSVQRVNRFEYNQLQYLTSTCTSGTNVGVIPAERATYSQEQSLNHTFLNKGEAEVILSYPLCRIHFGQYQPTSVAPGDVDSYLILPVT